MSDGQVLTVAHVLISLVGIASGFVVAYGLVTNRRLEFWTAVFLLTTVATSASGFLFPAPQFTPAHALGIISLGLLTVAIAGKYVYNFAGWWQTAYVASSVAAFYLNFFVLIVQSFQKIPVLKDLAPTQSEWPFVVAQVAALVAFLGLGIAAARTFQLKPRWATRPERRIDAPLPVRQQLAKSTVLHSLFPKEANLQRWRSNGAAFTTRKLHELN